MAELSLFDIFTGAADATVPPTTDAQVVVEPVVVEVAKEKKPRKPREHVKKVKKAQHDKTAKEAAQTPTPTPSPVELTPPVPAKPAPPTRHCPGYSMLRVERDKIERSRVALVHKNTVRAAQGASHTTSPTHP